MFQRAVLCGNDEKFFDVLIENIEKRELKKVFQSKVSAHNLSLHGRPSCLQLVPRRKKQHLERKLNGIEKFISQNIYEKIVSAQNLHAFLVAFGYKTVAEKLFEIGIESPLDEILFISCVAFKSEAILNLFSREEKQRLLKSCFCQLRAGAVKEEGLKEFLMRNFGDYKEAFSDNDCTDFLEDCCKNFEFEFAEDCIKRGIFPDKRGMAFLLSFYFETRRKETIFAFIKDNVKKLTVDHIKYMIESPDFHYKYLRDLIKVFPQVGETMKTNFRDTELLKLVLSTNGIKSKCLEFLKLLRKQNIFKREFGRFHSMEDVKKRLDDMIIDEHILCEEGSIFWKKNFSECKEYPENVPVKLFMEVLKVHCDNQPLPNSLLFYSLFVKDKGVNLECFGRILGLFETFDRNWCHKVVEMCRWDFFWGDCSYGESVLKLQEEQVGAALVRFSSSGSNWTISYKSSTGVFHTRILHEYGSILYSLDSNNFQQKFTSLSELLFESILKKQIVIRKFIPCKKFEAIFGQQEHFAFPF